MSIYLFRYVCLHTFYLDCQTFLYCISLYPFTIFLVYFPMISIYPCNHIVSIFENTISLCIMVNPNSSRHPLIAPILSSSGSHSWPHVGIISSRTSSLGIFTRPQSKPLLTTKKEAFFDGNIGRKSFKFGRK